MSIMQRINDRLRTLPGIISADLKDLQWDEFGESDDHIVPYWSDEQQYGYGVQENCKRPRYELTSVSHRDASRNLKQSKEGKSCLTLKEMRGTMLEKTSGCVSSGSYASNEAVLTSRDSCPNKNASSTASEPNGTNNCSLRTNTNNSVGEELCDGDPILGDQVENNSFQYQLNQVTEPVSDLGFFNNVQQDKENGDLLYYGWPEIENFEDVDKMFRSCDSTFGLDIDKEDELSWFSPSHALEESNDALAPNFKFPGPDSNALNGATDCDRILKLNDDGCVIDETYERDTTVCWNSSSGTLDANNTAVVMNSSVENGSEATTQIDAGDQSMPLQSQKKLQTCGKRRGQTLEHGESFIPLDKSNQMEDRTQHLGNSCQCNSSQTTEYEQPTQLFTRNKPYMVKSEDNGRQSLSQNESSYASSQIQHKESCHDVSFRIPGVAEEKNKVQSHQGGLSLHREHAGLAIQSASSDPIIAQKKTVNIESQVEGHSGVDESGPSIPGEVGSSNVQDSAFLSSMVDEVSLEASSFLQLQHVIEKLDVKTKLCIRDSLYRLANSAEQRHKCAKLTTGGQGDGDESKVLASDETNKCTGFMDIETDTNPIDRSVAHLLFHRPSDPSVVPAVDKIPLTMVQNPCVEKLVLQEKSNDAGAE